MRFGEELCGAKLRVEFMGEEVAIASFARVGVCVSARRMTVDSSACWRGGPAGVKPNGGESENTTSKQLRQVIPKDMPQNSTHLHRSLCDHSATARSLVAEIEAVNQGD